MMRWAACVPLVVLAACSTAPPPVAAPPPPLVAAPSPGLERILGAPEAGVTALLGAPTLDRRDGPGHHLQFARAACILDVYFYPDSAGRAGAKFAAARLPDGKPIEAGDCLRRQVPAAR